MEEAEEEHAAATELLSNFLLAGESEDDDGGDEVGKNTTRRREMCRTGCGRPASVCICGHIPTEPLETSTTVFILHHPHELRNNPLATLPLLSRSLQRFHSVPGRRLRLGSHPLLDSLYRDPAAATVLFLFPSGEDLAPETHRPTAAAGEERRREVVLIAFDGTWRQAKEMATASAPFLERFATRVSLRGREYSERVEGESTFESELVLRKEPFKGCMSTVEAVARALRVLEPDDGRGAEVEAALLSALRAMVEFQRRHLKPMKPRPKLRKKKEEGRSYI